LGLRGCKQHFCSLCQAAKDQRAQIEEYLERLKALPISAEGRDLWSTVDLEAASRRWNLTAYDAAYLDLAIRKGLPLVTTDDDLKKAALAEGIEILSQ
jgi:predicted nucleic acid-binding protein